MLRIAGAVFVVLALAAVMSGAGLYFLLRGESLENSTLNRSIEANIERLLGPDYRVDLGRTAIAFDPDGLLSVASSDVRVLRATDRQPVSTLGRVVVGIRPFSLLGDEPQIDAVIIEDSTLDVAVLPLPVLAGPVNDFEAAFTGLGQHFARLENQFSRQRFRLFRFSNVRVRGLSLGRLDPQDVAVKELEVHFRRKSGLGLQAEFATQWSDVKVDGSYSQSASGGSQIKFAATGISLREWLRDPGAIADGPVGWDGVVSLDAAMAFAADGSPSDPRVGVKVGDSTLRLGRYATTTVDDLKLNLRLIAAKNQIELDPSVLAAGDFNARLVGGVRPADPAAGYGGPLEFELIADPATGTPTIVGEERQSAAIRLSGRISRKQRMIDISTINVLVGRDRIDGSAIVGFGKETPSIAAAAASEGMPVAAIKQLWPYWLAPKPRDWAFRNIVGGRVSNIKLDARIPGGIIGRFRQGAKLAPQHLDVRADFDDVRFDTFGELPPIRNASGNFRIVGMKMRTELDAGEVFVAGKKPVKVTSGAFEVADYGERPARAEAHVVAEGASEALARVSASHPLNVPQRLDMRADDLSGDAHVDVVARFPLQKGLKPQEVDWNAIVTLEGAASRAKIEGRKIANANLQIEATPKRARITGTAEIDGVPTSLELNEPMGGAGFKPERVFTAVVDDKARRKMGLTLDPVVTGTMKVRFQQGDGEGETHVIDLRDAELSLPWVGWRKGKGIAAQASFRLRTDDAVTHLDDFYIEGPGFSAAGTLAFDKNGIVSADFANVSLNEGDSLAVRIDRKGQTYRINAEGARYDARALINKLIHEGGFGDAQGETNVVMTANIGSVTGFGETSIRKLSMSYGTAKGWFDNLSLRGTFSDSEYASVVASTRDGRTTFEIDTTNAGAALRMVDVYRRMTGGRLVARLTRQGGGPFVGPVRVTSFTVENEPRLRRLVSDPMQAQIERGANPQEIRRRLDQLNTNRVRFQEAIAVIDKGEDYLRVSDGILRSTQIGFTFDGLLYDDANRMDLTGTFMPGMSLSRAIGFIPLVGELLGNGRDSSLLGITFRLSGQSKNPTIEVNPISVVAPGVFRKVFEFRN